jgi:hypothetical protein
MFDDDGVVLVGYRYYGGPRSIILQHLMALNDGN